MNKTPKLSKRGEMAERALREAVADAVEEHRRTGTPLIVQRNGRIVKIDPRKMTPVEKRKTARTGIQPKGRHSR
jgi:hypothetical protein